MSEETPKRRKLDIIARRVGIAAAAFSVVGSCYGLILLPDRVGRLEVKVSEIVTVQRQIDRIATDIEWIKREMERHNK